MCINHKPEQIKSLPTWHLNPQKNVDKAKHKTVVTIVKLNLWSLTSSDTYLTSVDRELYNISLVLILLHDPTSAASFLYPTPLSLSLFSKYDLRNKKQPQDKI